MKKYKTIYADPPWEEKGGGKIKRGADRHYPLMGIEEILSLKVQDFADETGCHLYLWVTNGFLPMGLRVMDEWGFNYKTTITWAKDRFGLGQYFRGQTEHCLFGVMGNIPYRTKADGKRAQGRTLVTAPRREHSRKPDEMRSMIELVSPGPYLELFARENAPGWDAWGFDVKPDIQLGFSGKIKE